MSESVGSPGAILRRREVERTTGLRKSQLYELIGRGKFPKPILLGSRSVGWLEREITDWVSGRIRESRGAP